MSDVYAADEFEDLGGDFEEDPAAGLDRFLDNAEIEVTIEARARAMGWKPLPVDPRNPQPNEYRGDPRHHRSAAEFIAHGEQELPILRDNNKRMSERLARLEPEMTTLRNTIAEQSAAIKRATTIAQRADQAGYDRAMAELKARQREAVETGDTVAYDQVQAQIDASLAARREVEAEPDPEPAPPAAPATEGEWPETTEFKRGNPWLYTSPDLARAMIAAHQAALSLRPDLSRAAQYAHARAQVVAAFPTRFPDEAPAEEPEEEPLAREPVPAPARQPARAPARAAVMSPSAPQPSTPGRRSVFEQIPEEDRTEARAGYEYARKGDPDLPASEYVALYLNPKLNPLELRAQRKKA